MTMMKQKKSRNAVADENEKTEKQIVWNNCSETVHEYL